MIRYEFDQGFGISSQRDCHPLLGSYMLRYFSVRAVMAMIGLTVSLLVLPLLLPPLPPPPSALLFLPVLIMLVLIFLALSPSQVPNVAVTSV